MKKLLLLLPAVLLACSSPPSAEQLKRELMNADRKMSAQAAQNGFMKTIYEYADDSLVKFEDGSLPVTSKNEWAGVMKENPGTRALTWAPVKAEVAQSGELGYTWGYWKYVRKDTTMYGDYFTVWKKQKDGSWKVALDGGNSTPAPK